MELKKNPKIDLVKKRPMFLSVGLLISLLFVTTAFEWTSQSTIIHFEDEYNIWDDEPVEAIATIQTPPKRPKVVLPVIIPVEDEIETKPIDIIIDTDEIDDYEPDIEEPLPVEVVDEAPRAFVETMPEPLEGMLAFQKFLARNIKYPSQARRMGIQGRVFVQFVVDKKGNITDIKTIKGIGAGCDEEAERVMGILPKWKPGKQGYKRVAVRMIMPINFRLNK